MNTRWVISLPKIKVRAFHGIHSFEKKEGNDFEVSLKVIPEIDSSLENSLDSTIDYEHLYRIVNEEMEIASDLLEDVARRISRRIMREQPTCREVETSISKLHPKTMPNCESARVTITMSR